MRMPRHPCLRYNIGLCRAPCAGHIDKEEYAKDIEKASISDFKNFYNRY